MDSFHLNLLWQEDRESWFENYIPADYQLSQINKAPKFSEEKYHALADLVEVGLRCFGSKLIEGGLVWNQSNQDAFEEAVDISAGMLNYWAREYTLEITGEESEDHEIARNGLHDSQLLMEIFESINEDEVEDEDESYLNYPFTEQQIWAAFGLWKIDHAMTAINEKRLNESICLVLDAANAINESNKILTIARHTGNRLSKEEHGSAQGLKGAKAKDARYDPLRKLAIQLAESHLNKSKRQAVMAIAPKIVGESIRLGVNLSLQQAERTISNWLGKSGLSFAGKRGTPTG